MCRNCNKPSYSLVIGDVDVIELWASQSWVRDDFITHLTELLEDTDDPDGADALEWCTDCENPIDEADAVTIHDGDLICQTCRDENYFQCEDCDEIYHHDNECYMESLERRVCDNGCSDYYSFCDECEGYYRTSDYVSCPNCPDVCNCGPYQTQFTIRNDGHDPLPNDTRVEIGMPSGVIAQEGMEAIAEYLQSHSPYRNRRYCDITPDDPGHAIADLACDVADIGDEWQTKRGNFTKRLSQHAHKKGVKLSPEIISTIGNIAREHSQGFSVFVEFTRELNMGPEEFAHEDSCWWGEYGESRCMLKSSGGLAIRSFVDEDDCRVTGRAWIVPLKVVEHGVEPTFDLDKADGFIVTNGYEALPMLTAGRILAHMLGLTYAKVPFGMEHAWINSDHSVLVASPEVIETIKSRGGVRVMGAYHSDLHQAQAVAA